MPKTTVRDLPRTNGWTFAHCPPSSQWGPGGNTGEIKAARNGTGHPTSQSRWLRTSVLSNRHSLTYGSYMGLTFTFTFFITILSNDPSSLVVYYVSENAIFYTDIPCNVSNFGLMIKELKEGSTK